MHAWAISPRDAIADSCSEAAMTWTVLGARWVVWAAHMSDVQVTHHSPYWKSRYLLPHTTGAMTSHRRHVTSSHVINQCPTKTRYHRDTFRPFPVQTHAISLIVRDQLTCARFRQVCLRTHIRHCSIHTFRLAD